MLTANHTQSEKYIYNHTCELVPVASNLRLITSGSSTTRKLPMNYPWEHVCVCVCVFLNSKLNVNQAFHLKVEGMQEMEWPDTWLLSPVTTLSTTVNGELCACSVRAEVSHTFLLTSFLYYNGYSANSNTIRSIKLLKEWARRVSSCAPAALLIPGPAYSTCILYKLQAKTPLSNDRSVPLWPIWREKCKNGTKDMSFLSTNCCFHQTEKHFYSVGGEPRPSLQWRHWISIENPRLVFRTSLPQ